MEAKTTKRIILLVFVLCLASCALLAMSPWFDWQSLLLLGTRATSTSKPVASFPQSTPTAALPEVTIIIKPLSPSPESMVEISSLTPTPTALTSPQVIIETATPVPTAQLPSDAAFAYFHALASGNTPHLLDSYTTAADFDDSDTAWTYDNVLVLLAFLARGIEANLAAARTSGNYREVILLRTLRQGCSWRGVGR